jgi:long-chain acyl-CoA synthetase
MLTFTSIIGRTVLQRGDEPAIVDHERNLTWREFADRIARAAGVLQGLGVEPGRRYAILSRNGVRMNELVYAGYWLGAVPVPINYRLAPAEIRYILDDAECGLIAVEDVLADKLDADELAPWRDRLLYIAARQTETSWPQYEPLMTVTDPIPCHDAGEQDDAIIIYTGGTTGRGKGVPLSHRNIVSNAVQLVGAVKAGPDDVHLQVSPMFHSTYMKSTVYSLVGARHAFISEFSPQAVLAAIERYRVTVVSLVPTTIILTAQHDEFARYDLSSLKRIIYGTSPIPVEWLRRCMESFKGVALQQGYGLTETSPIVAMLDPEIHVEALKTHNYDLLRAAGRALPGVDIRIVDDDGNDVPPGEAGEVALRGPQIARGYLNRPEETEAAFRDGWFFTGDIGRIDEQGFLFILDRKKDMIVTGGENVYASEVEAALHQHPDIQEVAIIGVPDERFGEALFAVIVPADGATPSEEEIIAHCRGKIGGYKIPRHMAFVDQLPKSALGKILKAELRRIYGSKIQHAAR